MKLFTSATLKLAGWYLLILMTVSLLFSTIIFQIARSEVQTRLERFVSRSGIIVRDTSPLGGTTEEQLDSASANLLGSLGYLNLLVLLAGGAGAYFLARRTLMPIEAAHDAQSRFVANASHQLRTPLAIMRAETELILDDKTASKAELRETLASNLEEVNHLTKLSSMLLELSRNSQELSGAASSLDLTAIINEIIAKRQASKRIRLNAPNSAPIKSHETAIREILTVLIDNAIQHSPKNTPISINISTDKNCVNISISNEGSGINKQQLPHIFERFYRATNDSSGYGLGLALAKQLVELLGGNISAQSAENEKTTFSVKLPRNFS